MLTMSKTVSTQLDTPAEIAAYLKAAAADGLAAAGLAHGDVVRIVDRATIPDGVAVGDVGVVLAGAAVADLILVLCATEHGIGVALAFKASVLKPLA